MAFRRSRLAVAIAGVGACLTIPEHAEACTAFLLEGGAGPVVGKSYDWHMGQGLVFANKQGVAKRALTVDPRDTPASWVSRHASLTFNQYGREFPNGGMNDAGLVVEILWLDDSRYEARDARPALNELQWIQYQLDSFATVAEMTAAAATLRVSPVYANVHYLACDRGARCAAFEWLSGKSTITPARVLTNHSHAESTAWAGRQAKPPQGLGSLERFTRTARAVAAATAGDPVPAAFTILDGVRGRGSQWNIVYDPVRLRVHFRTRVSKQIKSVDFAELGRDCDGPVQMLDIDADRGGDATARLAPYSVEANARLVERSLRPMAMAKQIPPGAAQLVSRYPDTLSCATR
jgi:penicillin V acylase-like amidase (Ntn superfamily)